MKFLRPARVNYTDPTGHIAITAVILLICVIGTAIAASPDLMYDIDDLSLDLEMGNYGWAAFDVAMMVLPAVPARATKPVINTAADVAKSWLDDVGGWFRKSDDVVEISDDVVEISDDVAKWLDKENAGINQRRSI